MSLPKPTQVSGLAAILGGVMLIVHSVGTASMPRGCIGNEECATRPMRDTGIYEVFFLLALPLIFAGMVGLALRARRNGSFGALGWTGVILGAVAVLVFAFVAQTSLYGGDFQLMLFFVIPGGLALIVGFALMGVAVLRAGVLPRWVSALLVASTIAMLGFNDQNAFVLFGVPFALAWMAAGYALWSGEGDPDRRTEPARQG